LLVYIHITKALYAQLFVVNLKCHLYRSDGNSSESKRDSLARGMQQRLSHFLNV
jgi:hypothetical protein